MEEMPRKKERYAEDAEYVPSGVHCQMKRSLTSGCNWTSSSFSQRSTYSYNTGAVCGIQPFAA
jgi:hypothetical protein